MRTRVWVAGPSGLQKGGEELLPAPGNKWIDVEAPEEAGMERLAKTLTLHPLEVEDSLHFDQRPKLEEYPNHLFFVLHGHSQPRPDDTCRLDVHELHFFLGQDWLLTVHDSPLGPIEAERAHVEADVATTLARGPDFVAYLVADALVNEHFPILDSLIDEVDGLEDRIFRLGARPVQSRRIFRLKRALSGLRRLLAPQREALTLLSREGIRYVQPRTALYFRDVYDHLVRVHEQLEAARDEVGSAIDAYLAMLAQRTNEITKQLTVFAAIFLPLSFVVGFFGQNFEVLSHRPFFWLMLASMPLVPLAQWFWFKRKGWF